MPKDIRDLVKRQCSDEEFKAAQEQFWKSIREMTGLTDEQLKRFDAASSHPYECRCAQCLEWWSLVPPEDE